MTQTETGEASKVVHHERKTPPLVKLFLGADAVLRRLLHTEEVLRDEMLWAFIKPPGRQKTNNAIYGQQQSRYLPGGERFDPGLHDWERLAVMNPPFPQSGRILLGGAGGGRELKGLVELGYEVLAFEPSPPLADGLRRVAARLRGCEALCASYQDMLDAFRYGSGPLAPYLSNLSFDVVIFGWGSVIYVLDVDDRKALLHAARHFAPGGPVLLSYLSRDEEEDGLGRLRPRLRRLFAAMGGSRPPVPGDVFVPRAGFLHRMSHKEVGALAAATGYAVAYIRPHPYPHAVLTPLAP
jgi:SAM-dependent methyltransferase